MCDTKKDSIIIKEDASHKTIYLKDSLTKNHRGQENSTTTKGFIVESNNSDCPVKLLQCYLSHLHPGNDFLWQRPVSSFKDDDKIWYSNQKIGVNTMTKMMSSISRYLNLQKIYTNHCLRATAITLLGRTFQDTEIQAISGHKSLNALGIYKRTSQDILRKMSNDLHKHIACKRFREETIPKQQNSNILMNNDPRNVILEFNNTINEHLVSSINNEKDAPMTTQNDNTDDFHNTDIDQMLVAECEKVEKQMYAQNLL